MMSTFETVAERPGDEYEAKQRETSTEMSETPFFGHGLTPEGVKPDHSQVEEALKMGRPNDVVAVRRLMGLVNFFSKFLSKFSELCELLRRLTHKGVEWSWSTEPEKTCESVKQALVAAPILDTGISIPVNRLKSDMPNVNDVLVL